MSSEPESATSDGGSVIEALPENYFELYKMAVEMADRVSARRATANGFFLTINTGLVALVGGTNLRWYVAAAGIVFSGTWWLLLKSYRRLNTAKFTVIVDMEQRLPKQLFADEYSHYARPADAGPAPANLSRRARLASWATRYRELGEVERIVPAIFALIYLAEIARQVGI